MLDASSTIPDPAASHRRSGGNREDLVAALATAVSGPRQLGQPSAGGCGPIPTAPMHRDRPRHHDPPDSINQQDVGLPIVAVTSPYGIQLSRANPIDYGDDILPLTLPPIAHDTSRHQGDCHPPRCVSHVRQRLRPSADPARLPIPRSRQRDPIVNLQMIVTNWCSPPLSDVLSDGRRGSQQ